MTDDQIIAVAKVVRAYGHWNQLDIINFGRLIAAVEREACADICDQHASIEGISQRCAESIRVRSNP